MTVTETAPPARPDDAPPGKTSIVVADHSADYLDLLALLIRVMPTLEVVGRTLDGTEAVRAVLESGADIALLEVQMAGLDGFEAAAEILRLRPQTTVFLHTGLVRDHVRERARELDLYVFEKLELVKSLELLARVGRQRHDQ
jgi:chemotaxis response regulator CheB